MHKWQEGFVYVRVKRIGLPHRPDIYGTLNPLLDGDIPTQQVLIYADNNRPQRVIASARVERAVENDYYMRLCDEQDLTFEYRPYARRLGAWTVLGHQDVSGEDKVTVERGETLREAYWRCRSRLDGTYGISKKAARRVRAIAAAVNATVECCENVEMCCDQTPVRIGPYREVDLT